ncbi:MAG: helix-turn-helix transcriptional regulator [Rhizobiaceae bacterium]
MRHQSGFVSDTFVKGANGKPSVSPEWLSRTVGDIYDCVLEPERWENTIERLVRPLSFTNGALAVLQMRPGANHLKAQFGFDPEWIAVADDYVEDAVRIWGGQARMEAFPLCEPIVATNITPRSRLGEFGYYRDVLGPRGIHEAVVLRLTAEPTLLGYLGLNRHHSDGEVLPEELEALRLIAPHLRRAVTISNLFDLQAVENATFRAVLDRMACAVVLVDADLMIVHANDAAQGMLAGGDLLSAEGRLGVRGKLAGDALRAAVRLAADNEAAMAQRGIGIPALAEDGSPAVLHVLPLQHRALRSRLSQRAVAAVFVVSGAQGAQTPVDAIATLYDFTPAESLIFASLCRGLSLEQTAETLGIARSTAKTHLLRVFEKTGCKRQAEIVALGARLSLSL